MSLVIWANSRLTRVEALSDAKSTAGTTYLLVGSDSRADGQIADGTEGHRADTIILLHRARNGQTSMISLPRDTLVTIPESGDNKLNASYAWGGAPLLVRTVEGLTGLTVDHYVEIGMGGVVNVVDAVGGVELCLDYDVNDELSELVWTAGCHEADGRTALAFARMRYSDPLGDIGRGARQRQVIGAVVREAATPGTLVNPARQVRLISAGVSSLTVGERTGVIGLGRLGLAFRKAIGDEGLTGTPPIASMGYDAGAIGSVVLLSDAAPEFFERLRTGQLTDADFEGQF
ncbi:MAG TPA: LCP family protein [Actinomycetaceae bacterium]|nr:LCP family protein [Actinomycetaceae bacterium]